MKKRLTGLILTIFFGVWAFVLEINGFQVGDQVLLCLIAAVFTLLVPVEKSTTENAPFKIRSGAKYGKEKLNAGDILRVKSVSCWAGTETDSIRHSLVFFENSFPMFAHVFEMIAEEVV
jgi:hypothetical protein